MWQRDCAWRTICILVFFKIPTRCNFFCLFGFYNSTICMLEISFAEDPQACEIRGCVGVSGTIMLTCPDFSKRRESLIRRHSVTSRKVWNLSHTTLTVRDLVGNFVMKQRGHRDHLCYVSSLAVLYMLVMTWYMIWYDMIRYDIWYDMIWYIC